MTATRDGQGQDAAAGVPAGLAERVARDLAGPPPPPVGARQLGARIAVTLLGAQVGSVAVALALGVRPAPVLVLVIPTLVASAALVAGAVALGREAIPGRGPAARAWALAVGLGTLAAVALAFVQDRTAPEGPVGPAGTAVCLGMGVLVALVPALLALRVVRRGHAVRRRLAGLVLGVLAGLVGLTTLHLHCGDVSFGHTGPMHMGVVGVLGALGALGGGVGLRVEG